jgi:hypothetical protein
MSFQLSTPVKIVALVGVVLVLGAAGSFLLLQRNSTTSTAPVVAPRTQPHAHPAVRTHPTPAPTAPKLVAGLPAPLVSALSRSKVVVAVVWVAGDPVSSYLLAQARQGAQLARAKLVLLNVGADKVAGQTATWMKGVIVDPAVLVVTRPGTVAVELDGYADKMAVAQAVVNSRS